MALGFNRHQETGGIEKKKVCLCVSFVVVFVLSLCFYMTNID